MFEKKEETKIQKESFKIWGNSSKKKETKKETKKVVTNTNVVKKIKYPPLENGLSSNRPH